MVELVEDEVLVVEVWLSVVYRCGLKVVMIIVVDYVLFWVVMKWFLLKLSICEYYVDVLG